MEGRRLVQRGFLMAALLAIAFGGSQAHAEERDANCRGPVNNTQSVEADQRAAQTFTAIHTGSVVAAAILVNKGMDGADFQLQILATDATGNPVNGILGFGEVDDSSVDLVPFGATPAVGRFQSPASIVAGQQYALVITRPGGTGFFVGNRGLNPCDGDEFLSSSQTAPFSIADPNFDAVFVVYVEPLTAQAPIVPSNQFTIGKLKGRALTLVVPGEGSIGVAEAAATRAANAPGTARKKVLKPSQASAAGPGKATVTLRLTRMAKRLLRARDKVKARAAITFTPTGGEPNTQTKRLRLKHK